MRRVGQTRKRDTAEGPIVDALRQVGAMVLRVSGPGCPDLLVGFRGRWIPIEVKTGKGRLTKAQEATNQAMPFIVARTPDEAVQAILTPQDRPL